MRRKRPNLGHGNPKEQKKGRTEFFVSKKLWTGGKRVVEKSRTTTSRKKKRSFDKQKQHTLGEKKVTSKVYLYLKKVGSKGGGACQPGEGRVTWKQHAVGGRKGGCW